MPSQYSRQIEQDGEIMKFNQQTHDGSTVGTRSTASSRAGLNLPPPLSRGAAGSRSAASSTWSSVAPPPGATTLERAEYMRVNPGAQRFPGNMQPDDGTIIIGDGQSSVTTHSTLPYEMTSARPIQSSSSQGPITAMVHAMVPGTAHEAPSAQVQGVSDVPHGPGKAAAKAEPMEGDPKPFWKDKKTMCCLLFLFLLAIGLGVGFAVGLNNTANDSAAASVTNTQITTNPPTKVAISAAPSPSPTFEFTPPNLPTCETISEGEDVDAQALMIATRFTLDLDVTVAGAIQDLSPFLEDIQSVLLQQEIAPEIAHCYDSRRKLEQSRGLLDRFVVGNAIFETVELVNSGCASVTTENCFPILATLVLYLKDEESNPALITHISDVFSERWEFGQTLKSIQLTGARLYTPGGPTAAPSYEDEYEDEEYEDEDENSP